VAVAIEEPNGSFSQEVYPFLSGLGLGHVSFPPVSLFAQHNTSAIGSYSFFFLSLFISSHLARFFISSAFASNQMKLPKRARKMPTPWTPTKIGSATNYQFLPPRLDFARFGHSVSMDYSIVD
jgi:hypothetical protein